MPRPRRVPTTCRARISSIRTRYPPRVCRPQLRVAATARPGSRPSRRIASWRRGATAPSRYWRAAMQDRTPDPSELDPIERASIDELQALQLERLQTTLHRVYEHVPHYRSAFDVAGIHPEDMHELADIARFPFTSKADLRKNY